MTPRDAVRRIRSPHCGRLAVAAGLLAAAAAGAPGRSWAATQGAEGAVTAFVDVAVVPMDSNRVLEHQTVVVRGGRIEAIGPTENVPVPPHAVVVAGAGKYLMPGLVDMHIHLPDTGRVATNRAFQLYLANGVTTVRVMSGRPDHLVARDRVARGEELGPTLFVAAATVGGLTDTDADMRRVLTGQEAARLAEQTKAAGYDFVQLGGNLMREEYDGLVGAARRVGLRVVGGVPDAVGLGRALKARQSSIESLDGYINALEADDSPLRYADPLTRSRQIIDHLDERKIPRLARDIREAGVANIPTLFLNQTSLSREPPESQARRPEMRYVPAQTVDNWIDQKWRLVRRGLSVRTVERVLDIRGKLVKGLYDGGVRMLVGSDSPGAFLVPGFAAHHEMQSFVAVGIPPYATLAAATRDAAEYLRGSVEFGTVAVGRRADLLVLEGNPLEDITSTTRIAGVMVRGRWLSRTELDAMLEQVASAAAQPPS